MAQYTRSAAEQFRPEEATVGWLWNIFIFSVVIFGSVALLYVGMEFGYGKYLANEKEKAQSEIDALKSKISAEDQNNLSEFYSQVYNVNRLLSRHVIVSRLLDLLGANTNTAVYYTKFGYTRSSNIFTISGIAPSFEFIPKQLEALRRLPEVKEVILSNAAEEENAIKFNIRVTLNTDFLINN